jgi:hypothetical protein
VGILEVGPGQREAGLAEAAGDLVLGLR